MPGGPFAAVKPGQGRGGIPTLPIGALGYLKVNER
jgi:hypothetical protein